MHDHNIVDSDVHFLIEPSTRSITTESEKLSLVQYDHNSERFTFEIPQIIENHDMSLCNRIEIHYTNITRNKRQQNDDVYLVPETDISNDGNALSFSWLISRNATQLVGSLKFSISFVCIDEKQNVTYEWSTGIFEGIQILTKLEHVEQIIKNNPDLIEQLKQGAVNEDAVLQIVEKYMTENPPAPGEDGENGQDGLDGKSAYEYAQDGGYTGTEEEFAAKLAEESAGVQIVRWS